MATTAAPYGARPIGTLSASGSFSSKTRNLPIITTYGTQISNGDFVKVAADGTIAKDTGTTALTAVGIFLGCSYTDPTTSQKTFSNWWPASNAATDAMAYVLDDPFVVFQMQSDEALNTTDRGLNASVVVTAGSTTIGKSKNALDGSTPATTNTLPLRIIDFVEGPNSLPPKGTVASDAYPDVIVKFNAASSGSASNHSYLNATG
ncbi:hypothetical protein CMI37_12440, partial [Candidatus Pacearchaeota archaeon]|nr:hypothetical protein [Candidatus Pacearchaeota archaeon]